ncbi:DeoR/GlpR transcriptional regulator [Lactobacillus sp. DCY120]|uniref:DeoR/GlpR transcriptional regulator n=1 Tax=Bombilactobacillus apium TaxID=2675299 RepID=A0A850RA84_9LACO|nr:DeoR family transcriptional regulator [Bombilactobacillus apium]NVY95738.1 DeoR/GlpR transcriptional regulator [Bombilactobacillus apium]
MITEKRRQLILHQVQIQTIVNIHDLMQLTNTSASTIRRDLDELEQQHLLCRVHGGAKALDLTLQMEPKVAQREQLHIFQKQAIAQCAANLVQDDDVIFLDSGTTTRAMIPHLSRYHQLLVLTNGVDTASCLAEAQIRTIVLGGQLRNSTKAVVGQSITDYLNNCHLDRAFMGTNGFDFQAGYTTPDPEESAVKRLAIRQAKKAYVLTDASKYQQIRFSKFADLSAATLITDQLPRSVSNQLAQLTQIMEV